MPKSVKQAEPRQRRDRSIRLQKRRLKSVPRAVFSFSQIAVADAQGARIRDVDGNDYIDFGGGLGCLNVGHRHPSVVAALKEQIGRFHHVCFHVCNYEGYVRLAERLCLSCPGDFAKKAVLLNSGAEAVENAVKAAKVFTGRPEVISFDLGFHGRTSMGMALTGKDTPYRKGFGPFPPGVHHATYPYPYRPPAGVRAEDLTEHCLSELVRLLATRTSPDRVAAVVVEPLQGEGGFIVPTPGFLPGVRRLCKRFGILLIVDEVQTGVGRTGRMWACEHSGVVPDLMTVGKSLAAGLPLSAVVGRADVLDAVPVGGLGGTYGGNPLACAAALAVLDVFEREDLLARAAKLGTIIETRFDAMAERCPGVGDSRGLGPMRAIELVKDRKSKAPIPAQTTGEILDACAERGLLILKAGLYGNVIRCLVPLNASEAKVRRGLDILEEVVSGKLSTSKEKR
ncbi:MAG: 4-aminobutyrate--2-oxoglutarate transaminase [Elusimicrobiota bacterium]